MSKPTENKVSGSAQRRTATFIPESLEVTEKVFIFAA